MTVTIVNCFDVVELFRGIVIKIVIKTRSGIWLESRLMTAISALMGESRSTVAL